MQLIYKLDINNIFRCYQIRAWTHFFCWLFVQTVNINRIERERERESRGRIVCWVKVCNALKYITGDE